jgi:hypothetical protein
MSIPFIEMPQRLEALPLMTKKPAMARGARVLAGIALDHHRAAHHVLGHAGANGAFDMHGGLGIHARAVIAGGAVHRHLDGRVEPHGNGVAAARVHDLPRGFVGLRALPLKRGVERAQPVLFDVDCLHGQCFQK